MTATYATPIELTRFMRIASYIPNPDLVGSERIKETIGTGGSSATRFFLDHSRVISGSYTISYGDAESSVTDLTETTEYTIDRDLGELTLTNAGITAITTASLFGKYAFNEFGISDTEIQEALDKAQDEIDSETGQHWATNTDATPDYIQVTNEKQTGKGKYNRDYFTDSFPLPDVSTTVNGAITAGDVTITVVSTDGFPESGYITIETNKIAYTGKGATTFTGCTNVLVHDDEKLVYPGAVEVSVTSSGTTPSWSVLERDVDYDVVYDTGKIHIYRQDYDNTYYALQSPPRYIPNRFRITYMYGNKTITGDVKRLCLMIAAKELLHTVVRSAHASGLNNFKPEMIGIDEEWIKQTLLNLGVIAASNI